MAWFVLSVVVGVVVLIGVGVGAVKLQSPSGAYFIYSGNGGNYFDIVENSTSNRVLRINQTGDIALLNTGTLTIPALSSAGVVVNSSAGLLSTATTITGLTSVTSTTFVGALTGNASTATNVAASGITGTTLASGVTASSLTSIGTLVSGSIPYSLITGTPSLTGYVTYTGATGPVNLGTNSLTASNLVLDLTGSDHNLAINSSGQYTTIELKQ